MNGLVLSGTGGVWRVQREDAGGRNIATAKAAERILDRIDAGARREEALDIGAGEKDLRHGALLAPRMGATPAGLDAAVLEGGSPGVLCSPEARLVQPFRGCNGPARTNRQAPTTAARAVRRH